MISTKQILLDRPMVFRPNMLKGLEAWFDALDTRTMLAGDGSTITDGGAVALWSDKSGNSGVNCLVLPGALSNAAYLGDNAAVSQTGDFEIEIGTSTSNFTPSAAASLVGKWEDTGNQRSYLFQLFTSGVLRVYLSADGSAVSGPYDSTAAVSATDFSTARWKFSRNATTGDITFYQYVSGAWSVIGTPVAGITGPIYDSTARFTIGAHRDAMVTSPYNGNVNYVKMRNGIDGTTVLDIDFSTAGKKLANGDTFVCATGQTVTLNSSGATGARIAGERDLFQGTLANRPVYLNYAGTKYGYLNGTAGNYFSTPDSAALDITGDITLTAHIKLASYTPSSDVGLISKWVSSAGQRSFRLTLLTTGVLRFSWSSDGTSVVNIDATTNTGVASGEQVHLRATIDADNGSGSNVAKFFKSADGVTWAQIGSTVTTAGAVAILSGPALVALGAQSTGASDVMSGVFFSAQITNGYDGAGTLVADFNPALYTSGTTFTASTGEVWTINGGAHIVTRTGLYHNGTAHYMKTAAFNLIQPETVYFTGEAETWTANDQFYDGGASNSGALFQTVSSPNVSIFAGTAVANIPAALKTTFASSVVLNGASSFNRYNRLAASSGNPGASNMNGFTLGSDGGGSTEFGNIFVSEVAIYSAAHPTATQDRMVLAQGRKHGFSV